MAKRPRSLFAHVLDAIDHVLNPFASLRDPRRYRHVYRRTVEESWRDSWKAIGDDLKKVMDRTRERLRREGKIV